MKDVQVWYSLFLQLPQELVSIFIHTNIIYFLFLHSWSIVHRRGSRILVRGGGALIELNAMQSKAKHIMGWNLWIFFTDLGGGGYARHASPWICAWFSVSIIDETKLWKQIFSTNCIAMSCTEIWYIY